MFNRALTRNVSGFILAGLVLSAPAVAQESYSSSNLNFTPLNQTVLKPGWRSSCSNNFVIENLGNQPAEVKITMGKDGLIQDRIVKWNKRGYDLVYSLSFAKQLGKTVDIDDVAMIENLSKDSKVSVHC